MNKALSSRLLAGLFALAALPNAAQATQELPGVDIQSVGAPCPSSGKPTFDNSGNSLKCEDGELKSDTTQGSLKVEPIIEVGTPCNGEEPGLAGKKKDHTNKPSEKESGSDTIASCLHVAPGVFIWSLAMNKPAPPRKEDTRYVYCPSRTVEIHYDKSNYFAGFYQFQIDGNCGVTRENWTYEWHKGNPIPKLSSRNNLGTIEKGFTIPGPSFGSGGFSAGAVGALGQSSGEGGIKAMGLNSWGLLYSGSATGQSCNPTQLLAGLCSTGYVGSETHIGPWMQ